MNTTRRPLIFVTSLFFLFGFITCLNDILIPHLKALFELDFTRAMLVQVCFFSAYFFMSIPSGRITHARGYRFGIVAGLLTAALGTLGFIPAAQSGSFPVFLGSLFVLASGITLLQVAVNPYVTLLGSPEGAAFRLNLVQAFNSLGTTLAPLAGSLLILENADKIRAIQVPYLILMLSLVTVALVFSRIALPSMSEYSNQEIPEDEGSFLDSLRRYGQTLKDHPRLVLGMLAIFFYVGAEVSIGSFLVSWLGDASVAGMSAELAGRYVALYWGGAMVGRFIGSVLTSRLQPEQVLAGSVLLCLLLILAGVTSGNPTVATWALILIGLFNSIQFPTIFSLSVSGLGKATPYASGLLCTCIVGGALIPLLQGVIADQVSLRWSYAVPFLSYLYILLSSRKLSSKGGLK